MAKTTIHPIAFVTVTRPAKGLQVRWIEAAFRCLTDRNDVIDHASAAFDPVSRALATIRFGGEHLVAELAPVGIVTAVSRLRSWVKAFLLRPPSDEVALLRRQPGWAELRGSCILQRTVVHPSTDGLIPPCGQREALPPGRMAPTPTP